MYFSAGRATATGLRKLSSVVAGTIVVLALFSASLILSSCSVLSGQPIPHNAPSNPSGPQGNITVQISPTSSQIPLGGSQQFSATVKGTSNVAVIWSAKGGTISSSGLFTASTSAASATVTATSAARSSASSTAALTFSHAASQLTITSTSLPSAQTGIPYSAVVASSGGTPPYTWNISGGSLPSGISLASNGYMNGSAVQIGTYSFTIKVSDSASKTTSKSLSMQVSTGPNLNYSGFDGPAELPRVYIQSAMSDTPAPGTTIAVHAGGNLQAALNSANCGDTILLQAGAIFPGSFKIPAKPCDDQHWIIVRTSSPDSALPAEGTRINPCFAGIASLPGRPAFGCPTLKNVMAQILFTGPGINGPFQIEQGANHYRFIGLEITRALPKQHLWDLVSPDFNSAPSQDTFTADHLVFDRVWVHGTATDETKGGIHLTGITYAAIVDSYFTDLHCLAMGTCTDAQAINGGEGSTPGGPYKIVNNFLEASTQSIMFGGGPATVSPADIEIRYNHLFKPAIWQQGAPGFVGGYNGEPFVVKNNFELKNAQRVLFEGNILEHSWGGFTQHGFAIVLTPANQGGHCPLCKVTDITIRYNQISSVAGGFDIGNVEGKTGALATAGERYSIHDVVLENVNKTQYDGFGNFAMLLSSSTTEVLNNVSLQHNTVFPDPEGHVVSILATGPPLPGFVFANNLILAPQEPIWSAGGGSSNCAASDVPLTVMKTCFPGYVFAGNLLVAVSSRYPSSTWPKGQLFTGGANDVGFVNYPRGNYALTTSSPYWGKGTDGRNIGADVAGLANMIAGVQ